MATTAKKAIMQALIEGVITELMVKTNVEQVFLDDSTTLAAKLAELIAALNTKAAAADLANKANASHTHAQSEVSGLSSALSSRPTADEVDTAISDAITALINGAPGTYDTLKEIADYISSHEDVVDTLNSAIGSKADKTSFEAVKATVDALGTLSKLNSVSESNLDSTLKTKISNLSSNVHSHSNKTVLDGITAAKITAWDGKATIYYSASQPAALAEGDLWVQLV